LHTIQRELWRCTDHEIVALDEHRQAGESSQAPSLPSEEVDVTYRRILLPVDGSAMAEQALPYAITQAQRFGAKLILLRVLESFPYVRGMSPTDLAEIRRQSHEWTQAYFDRVTASLQDQGIPVETVVLEGRPGALITEYAEANQVDLIVLCSRGRSGLSRWLMGSVADRVVRGATVPVLLVRAQQIEENTEPWDASESGP
jgi:nucleotide-binding universal stress UspA family protein